MLSTCLLSLLLIFISYCPEHQCSRESTGFQPVFLKDQVCAYGAINHEMVTPFGITFTDIYRRPFFFF